MKLIVTGASGFIGSRFTAMAHQAGHQVTGLTRPSSAHRLSEGVRPVYGTLPFDLPSPAIQQADIIVHLAAITTSDRAAQSAAVNDFGTRALLDLARQQATPFIFMSTQSALTGNQSDYATTKRIGEQYVRDSGTPYAILRPGLVYGPGESGLFARMRRTVESLPVLPLLGGGRAIVQAIHVDDLCTALLTIVSRFQEFHNAEFNLGDPTGVTMKDFLTQLARHTRQRPAYPITVPLWPIKAAVAIGETFRIPLPISRDNLKGLETVQRMETEPSLHRLQLPLRSLEDGFATISATPASPRDSRIPVALIGAGKIGIVHALQLSNTSRTRLAAVIEPSERAAALYRGMGFHAPFYKSLDAAMASDIPPVAAVIATPAHTHLTVAEAALSHGLHLLCEKPLSITNAQAAEWQSLRQKYPDKIIQAGYMAAQYPHLLTAFYWIRNNKLGKLKKITAVALQTHIMSPEPIRWEMRKDLAGGGSLINFGCHVASILFRLVGWPDTPPTGWHWPIHSKEVEDSLAARFSIKSIPCTLLVSWAAPGFARPLNYLELVGEHATMRIENYALTVRKNEETILMETQPDFDLEFNMSPDYTGAGFALEHESFATSIGHAENTRNATPEYMPPYEMAEALRLESWIRQVYETLPFTPPDMTELVQWDIPLQYIRSLNGEEVRNG